MEAIYKIYDLRKYYPNFVGANSIAVVSDLTEEELLLHCPELIRKQPFVLFSKTKWSMLSIRPIFSAIGTKSTGWIGLFSASFILARASNPRSL